MYTPPRRMTGQGSQRQHRKFQILVWLLHTTHYDEDFTPSPFGTYDIARGIGLKPTKHLRDMLLELCSEGAIRLGYGTAKNGVEKAYWYLDPQVLDVEKYHDAFTAYFEENAK